MTISAYRRQKSTLTEYGLWQQMSTMGENTFLWGRQGHISRLWATLITPPSMASQPEAKELRWTAGTWAVLRWCATERFGK